MHEFSIAASLVENVTEFAEAQNAARVLSVRLAIGELAQIEPDQLKFCYESITRNTILQDSQLEIETTNAEVRCPGCEYSGPPKYWDGALAFAATPTLQCPACGKTVEVIGGEECSIRKVRFTRE
jgi:hydrogenase nickel incorporation protein HypA/HybF